MKIYDTIIRSLSTEKSSRNQERGQYTFEVKKDATKIDIKNAVKIIYGVDVKNVRILIMPNKKRLIARGRLWTKRAVMKKAIVSLKGKQSIDQNKIGTKTTKPKPKK